MPVKIDKKILIVEDDPNFVLILKQKFEKEGFLVVVAQDGKEGQSIFFSEKPDLVLSDVLLPIQNGVEMIKNIKDKNEDLPVILLTNVKDENYSEAVRKMKKVDYLIKSDVRLDAIVDRAKKKLGIK
jgi:DNA-binding response OmpR family regulator